MPIGRRWALCGLAAAFLLLACSKKEPPEVQVRALLEQAEQAAEKKELSTLRGFIADTYIDEHGNDKRKMEGLLRFYFLRNQSVHLYTHIESVSIVKPKQVNAVLYVAMAGTPIPDVEAVQHLQLDFMRFEIEFVEDSGDWRATKASWRRAEPTDVIR